MTMEVRTILELIQIFATYSVCVLLFPYIVFYRYLHEKKLVEKFIICITIGNFYIMNIVFLMFLLRIPFTAPSQKSTWQYYPQRFFPCNPSLFRVGTVAWAPLVCQLVLFLSGSHKLCLWCP